MSSNVRRASNQMDEYQGLRFKYADVKKELHAISRLADSFLDAKWKWVLATCATELDNAQNSRGATSWAISIEAPVRTRTSQGEYRASGKEDGIGVYGELCFKWQIRNPDQGSRKQTHFVLNGIASTSITIKTVESDEIVARWQFEAGDSNSPGCHFHSAVNQYEKDGIFPEWLKVPRFPGFLLMPLDGLEFLLGELFQIEWHQHVSQSSHDRNQWSSFQKKRFQRILNWHIEQVGNSDTTPWMSLKMAKPIIGLFTE